MISRYVVAASMTSGSPLMRLTSHRAAISMTTNDATPHTRQNALHSRSAVRTRSNRCAPQFCPMNGATDADTAITTIEMTASMRDATENPAMMPCPESASSRVTIAVDSGATRFDAVAGNPTCRMSRAEPTTPRRRATSRCSFAATQTIHNTKPTSRAMTKLQAAPTMPSAGSPAQPKIRNGPITICECRSDRHHADPASRHCRPLAADACRPSRR